jgi:hypothetical protein
MLGRSAQLSVADRGRIRAGSCQGRFCSTCPLFAKASQKKQPDDAIIRPTKTAPVQISEFSINCPRISNAIVSSKWRNSKDNCQPLLAINRTSKDGVAPQALACIGCRLRLDRLKPSELHSSPVDRSYRAYP